MAAISSRAIFPTQAGRYGRNGDDRPGDIQSDSTCRRRRYHNDQRCRPGHVLHAETPFVYDRQIQITDAFQDIGGGFCQIVYTGVQVRMIGGWGNIRTKGVVSVRW